MLNKKTTCTFIVILILVCAHNAFAQTSNSLQFLPFANITLTPEYHFNNELDYEWQLNRNIYIDIFHYKNSVATFSLREEHLFGGQNSSTHEPSRIHYYPLEFISLKLLTTYGVWGISLDHECYNIIDQANVEPLMYRWYGAALTWQTANMLPNNKLNYNLKPGINLINSPGFYIYLGKSLESVEYNYEYIFKLNIRYNLFNWDSSLYYIVCKLYLPVSAKEKRTVLNRQFEIGSDISHNDLIINPFFKYYYQNDLDVYKGKSSGFFTLGLNFEKSIDFSNKDLNNTASINSSMPKYFFTDLDFTGQYGRYFFSNYVGYLADISLLLNIVKIENLSLNLNNTIAHSSMSGASDLFPRYLEYSYKTELKYDFKSIFHSATLFHKYTQFHEGNFYKGYYERYHLLGVSLFSLGMNNNYRFNDSSDTFNIFNYSLSAAKVLAKHHFNYSGIFTQEARINYYNSESCLLYFKPRLETLYKYKNHSKSYNFETGVTLHPGLVFELYYKFGKFNNIDKIDGAREYLHMLGLRIFN
jgi:hypothetical protein